MGVFGNIKDAKFTDGGVYLQAGVYRLEIQAVKHIKTRKGQDAFVAEFKILESSCEALQPGQIASWMVTLDKEPALGNIKQFLSIACGYLMEGQTPDQRMTQIDEAVVELAISDKQPLRGQILRASGANIKTKQGRDFTKFKFLDDSVGAEAVAKQHQEDSQG